MSDQLKSRELELRREWEKQRGQAAIQIVCDRCGAGNAAACECAYHPLGVSEA